MSGVSATHYYESTGFTPYYFAHVLYNIVRRPGGYLRKLEDILGDAATGSLCLPFPKFSNLHYFADGVVRDLFFEGGDPGEWIALDFIKHIGRLDLVPDPENEDDIAEAMNDKWVSEAFDFLIDEIFHILIRDVVFLQQFNAMLADYIERYGGYCDGGEQFTKRGRLKRVAVPQFVKDVIYHRDRGRCRSCKKAIDRILSPQDRERYDHIHPLALHGPNDIANLQLLCPPCNEKKAGDATAVSRLYDRLYPWDGPSPIDRTETD